MTRTLTTDGPESPEYVGDLGWVECPHCQRPVNAKPVRDEAMRSFVLRLAVLVDRGKVAPATLAKNLYDLARDLNEDVRRETARSSWPLILLEMLDPGGGP